MLPTSALNFSSHSTALAHAMAPAIRRIRPKLLAAVAKRVLRAFLELLTQHRRPVRGSQTATFQYDIRQARLRATRIAAIP